MKIFKNDWSCLLEQELQKDYYKILRTFLIDEYKTRTVYPDMYDIYNAFNYTPYSEVKVVILGQDPYHGPGQAHGLSFSVSPGVRIPPSLLNIYKELHSDIGCFIPNNGYLKKWADQGVLLLNTTLTVRANEPMSHAGKGWETFTDTVISMLGHKTEPVVFILWGSHAKSKLRLIGSRSNHLVITSPHPSPLSASRGFFGSRPFSKTNEFLSANGLPEVDWQIENI